MLWPSRSAAVTERGPSAYPDEGRPLSDGEVHFLWWFIQGSIMDLHTRQRLWRAWGLCARHAWGALTVEAAFRPSLLHGPALLYQDLMERAWRAFPRRGPAQAWRLLWGLRARGPCLMCAAGLGAETPGAAAAEILLQGRDPRNLRALAAQTRPYWEPTVCGCCGGSGMPVRCRPHLLAAIARGEPLDLSLQRALVEETARRVAVFARSFRLECRGCETTADRAALLTAVGWCSGWGPALQQLVPEAAGLRPEEARAR